MKTGFYPHLIATMFISVAIVSCGSSKNNDYEQGEDCFFDNPIDSIVQHTEVYNCFEYVYSYLVSHPDFVANSDSVGYHYYACNDYETAFLWKDCGDIRVYSIPWETVHSALGYNIVQIKGKDGKYKLDTVFLNDETGRMDNLFKVTCRTGKTYYILRTSTFTFHQGAIKWEKISAFSVDNGKLVKEKLFHTKTRQYDAIELECGGQRYIPIDYDNIDLICLDNFEGESDGVPVIVIAEINENDWPTGYGLKYQWNGEWFEYVGKCRYDADEMIRDY